MAGSATNSSTGTAKRGWRSLRPGSPRVSTGTVRSSALSPRRIASNWPTSSIRCWPSTRPLWNRYRLGQLLSTITRHFLLLTATPHNGKEADFQLFMALLDGDRFEGKFREGVHVVDTSDLMRRLVKEQLLKFDGTLLFPERLAYTVSASSPRWIRSNVCAPGQFAINGSASPVAGIERSQPSCRQDTLSPLPVSRASCGTRFTPRAPD